jgi:hypothetical protein
MTDEELDSIEAQMTEALDGDHCRAVDTLVRGLIRTISELRSRRNAAKVVPIAQPAA